MEATRTRGTHSAISSLVRHEMLRMRTEWMAHERKERRLAGEADGGRILLRTTLLLV